MPANKYALIRYRVIDRLIRNKYKPYPAIDELMEACTEVLGAEVSKSTIEKDIHAMKFDSSLGFEAPIKFHRSHRGYYYEDPDYSLNDLPLQEDDVEAIRFAASTLDQFRDVGIFQQYASAIDKILNKVHVGESLGDTKELIQFEQQPTVRGNELIGEIIEAIQQSRSMTFNYQSYKKDSGKLRLVDPYLLKEYANRWYLIGYSFERKHVVVFGLDRMTDLVVTDRAFVREESFDPAVFFQHSIGITANVDAKPEEVLLRCTPVLTRYILSQPIHSTQSVKKEGKEHTDITLHVIPTYELEQLILSYGDEIEVLKPASLREKIAKRLEAARGRY